MGYEFMFLRVCEGDDPPVYWYGEWTQTGFEQKHQHYSDFLLAQIAYHAAHMAV